MPNKAKTHEITPAAEVKRFWEKHAYYTYDPPQNGGRARWLAIEIQGHFLIGTSLRDFAGKLWSHELGIHKYCLPLLIKET